MKHKPLYLFSLLHFACATLLAQPAINTNTNGGNYVFTLKKVVSGGPVRNQYKSSTCWCFSTNSFFESEIMRKGKGEVHLSEMFIVRNMYIQKAEHYLRYKGATGFGAGGEPHDVLNAVKTYGIIPFEAYRGMPEGWTKPKHGEMDQVLKAMLDAMLRLPEGALNPNWKKAFIGALDGYMGTPPDTFTYKGKKYTPKTFAEAMELNADDYVAVTSYTHHPFYTQFILEVPDNWASEKIYNVPLEDLQRITDNALNNNYAIDWASDVSEKGFSFKNGLAIVPVKDYEDMSPAEKDSIFILPGAEKEITQALRQQAFDNLTTTDDHGMLIMGLAEDQRGVKYYLVKNSWGTENDLGGYFYCSEAYFKYKTTSILVNKKALPKDIANKLGIKN